MNNDTFGKVLFLCFLLVPLTIILTLKIGGSSSLPILIEKDGYCKTQYGFDWKYSETKFDCYKINSLERNNFTELDFREVCPQNTFLSTKFYSECFHKGDVRNNP